MKSSNKDDRKRDLFNNVGSKSQVKTKIPIYLPKSMVRVCMFLCSLFGNVISLKKNLQTESYKSIHLIHIYNFKDLYLLK